MRSEMGKVTWGGDLSGSDLDNADRSQFKPYDGPTPMNGVYAFRVKLLKRGKSKANNPQLIVGLELVPRQSRPEDGKFKGYFIMDYIPVMESTAFRVAPFLDAIGVSGDDFIKRTTAGEADERGSLPIVQIGKWKNDGKKIILATLADDQDQQGNPRKRISSYWAPEDLSTADEPEDDEDDEEEEEEEEEPVRRKPVKKAASKKKSSPEPEDDDEEEEDDEDEKPAPKKAKKTSKPPAKKRRVEPEEDDDDDADEDDDDEDSAPF